MRHLNKNIKLLKLSRKVAHPCSLAIASAIAIGRQLRPNFGSIRFRVCAASPAANEELQVVTTFFADHAIH